MPQTPDQETFSMEGCTMLALSTFRRSEKAIEVAIEKSREMKMPLVVYVVDVDVARYFVGAEDEIPPRYRESCESEMLVQAEKEGQEHVATIARNAEKEGIEARTLVQLGHFAAVCLDAVNRLRPSLIVTTRSRRPQWVKKFFGAPVDELIAKAGCSVITV